MKTDLLDILFFVLLIIYFETILKAATFHKMFNKGYVFMSLFSIPVGIIFYLLTSSFSERTNEIIFIILILCLTFYYGAQLLYYKLFSTFASVYFFVGAGKATQFIDVLADTIKRNIKWLIFILLPAIFSFILLNKIKIPVVYNNHPLSFAFSAFIIQLAITFLISSQNKGMLSPSYLYWESFLVEESTDMFGLLTTGRLDVKNILKNRVPVKMQKPIKINEPANDYNVNSDKKTGNAEMENTQYNKIDIPFEELSKREKNENIISMHKYFLNEKPTKKNKYTGMFKGKNLIMITAESFSPYAIDSELTPTLYRMYEGGFKFNDFYTPLWGVSTSDGEYVACTGLLPKEGIWSFYKSSGNYLPYCMGNQLKNIGYETCAYHNNYYDYYFRDKSHPNMGYKYKGLGNGLSVKETWPESDIEMIENTIGEYIDKQPFHVYYMTVSGHLQYNFTGNYIAMKNKSLVDNLNYSDSIKAYLSCNIELDRAIENIIRELEKTGIAEDTLIAISPDHYPYGLTQEEISELSGHKVTSQFELYKGVFLLWAKGMKPVEINKTSSSLDILPTLSNLMGLEYDSRLLAGTDILSDSEPLVIFKDRSWITDKAFFNSRTGEIISRTSHSPDGAYIEAISKKVKQKFKISSMMLDNDYYNKII